MEINDTQGARLYLISYLLPFVKRHFALIIPCVLIAVYIFSFQFNGLLDMPNHLARSYIMLKCLNQESGILCQYFSVNFIPIPYLFADLSLMLLLKIFPPLIAEKVAIYALLSLLVISWYLFYKTVNKTISIGYLAGLSLVINNYLYNGFYAYLLSVSFSLFWLTYWWAVKDNKTVINQLILAAGMGIIFGVHLAGLLAVFITYSSYEAYRLLKQNANRISSFWRSFVSSTPILITFVGLYLFQQSICGRSIDSSISYKPVLNKLATITYPFINFSKTFDSIFLLLVLLILIWSLDKSSIRYLHRNFLFILSLIFFLLFIITPTSAHGVYDFDCRFLPFAYFTLFTSISSISTNTLAKWLICLVLATSFLSHLYYKRLVNSELSKIWTLLESCPPHKTLQVINSVRGFPSQHESRVSPFSYFFCYYVLLKQGVVSGLFDCAYNTNIKYFCYKDSPIANPDNFKYQFYGLSTLSDSDIKRVSTNYDLTLVIDKSDQSYIINRLKPHAFRLLDSNGYAYLFKNVRSGRD